MHKKHNHNNRNKHKASNRPLLEDNTDKLQTQQFANLSVEQQIEFARNVLFHHLHNNTTIILSFNHSNGKLGLEHNDRSDKAALNVVSTLRQALEIALAQIADRERIIRPGIKPSDILMDSYNNIFHNINKDNLIIKP